MIQVELISSAYVTHVLLKKPFQHIPPTVSNWQIQVWDLFSLISVSVGSSLLDNVSYHVYRSKGKKNIASESMEDV